MTPPFGTALIFKRKQIADEAWDDAYRMPPFLSNAGTMEAGCSDMRCTNRSSTSNKFSSYIYSSNRMSTTSRINETIN